jgi:hypothetical protein
MVRLLCLLDMPLTLVLAVSRHCMSHRTWDMYSIGWV